MSISYKKSDTIFIASIRQTIPSLLDERQRYDLGCNHFLLVSLCQDYRRCDNLWCVLCESVFTVYAMYTISKKYLADSIKVVYIRFYNLVVL